MSVDGLREVVKRLSEFRSEALLGRYVKALKLLQSLQNSVSKLSQQADPKLKAHFQQVKVVLEEEGDSVRQLYKDFLEKPIVPPTINPRPSEATPTYDLRKSEIAKWNSAVDQLDCKASGISGSCVYERKSKPTEPREVQPKHLPNLRRAVSDIEHTKEPTYSAELKDMIEEKLIAPFTMPQFFKRITNKVVLLYGPQCSGKKLTTRIIAEKTGCRLHEITPSDLEQCQSADLSTTANLIAMVSNIHLLKDNPRKALSALAQRFSENKFTKNILMLTSSHPTTIDSELLSAVNLFLRVTSGDEQRDSPYLQFEKSGPLLRSCYDP